MESRWLGEVELAFNPSFLPFPCPDFHGEKTPRATVKLGIDLGGVFSKGPEQAKKLTRTGISFGHFRPYLPLMLSSEEANSLARRLPSRMGSVETFRLRVKLLNLQGRISGKYMEIRWLGEVELTFNPSFLPFPCPYIHGKKTPSHFP